MSSRDATVLRPAAAGRTLCGGPSSPLFSVKAEMLFRRLTNQDDISGVCQQPAGGSGSGIRELVP